MTTERDSNGRFVGKESFSVTCSFCGKPLKRHGYRAKFKHHFCNQECMGEYAKTHGNFVNGHDINNGRTPWNDGLTKETDERVAEYAGKVSIGAKKVWEDPEYREGMSGENSASWMGGISFEEYGKEFTDSLKSAIRDRDNHTCQECGNTEETLKYTLQVHHIDYDKKNNTPENLIALCRKCHAKTGFDRDDWTMYYKRIMGAKL